jgi:1-acyl-sn-glycerol-3-phosphate acyltransferase
VGYKAARNLIDLFVRLAASLEVHGYEHLPPSGGYVIASNHLGRLDVFLVYNYLKRDDIIMLVAEKYRKIAAARWFARQLDAIWIERFEADFAALRKAFRRLQKGGVMVLAPEGTRSPTGALIKARPGASYLAAKACAPIVPVAMVGSEDARVFPRWRRLKRAHVVVRAGEPFTLPPLGKGDREAVLKEYTDEIMCRIAALLPPEYRGVYADHPRLRELMGR